MEKTLSEQLSIFIWSCAFGVILGIFYDIFRFIRAAGLNSKLHVYIQDIVFMCFCSLFTFLFTTAFNQGDVRFFIVLGEFLGLLLYRYTVGEVTIRLFKIALKCIKATVNFLNKQINKLEKIIKDVIYKIYQSIKRFAEKLMKIKTKIKTKNQSAENS